MPQQPGDRIPQSWTQDGILGLVRPEIKRLIRRAFAGEIGGGTDHGTLSGLSDDDHTQYALADKTRPSPWVAAADLAARSIADLGTRDHDLLTGLADDDHTQYLLDAGATGGDGIDVTARVISIDLTTNSGLSIGTGELSILLSAVPGLLIASSQLSVIAGDGIIVTASGVEVDLTAISGLEFETGDLQVEAGDGIIILGTGTTIDLATDPGLEFDGATPNGELRVKVDTGIARGSAGIALDMPCIAVTTRDNASIMAAALTAVIWDQTAHENSGGIFTHDPVTNNTRITVSEAGIYYISAIVSGRCSAFGSGTQFSHKINARINGTTTITGDARSSSCNGGGDLCTNFTTVVSLSADDYVEIMTIRVLNAIICTMQDDEPLFVMTKIA